MHIEVVDDASPDVDIGPLVAKFGHGRVSYFRQLKNLGLIPAWNACLGRSRGQWVHMLHDDDRVLPGFYEAMRRGLEAHPHAASGFCRHEFIDEEDRPTHAMAPERETPGVLENWIDRLAVMQRVQFASVVVRRDVYETLGGFRPDMKSAADWEMWKRVAAFYPVFYDPQLLARFRLHGGSESARLIREGDNIADTLLAIEAAKRYLPPDRADALTSAAKAHYAVVALHDAQRFLTNGQIAPAEKQWRQALSASPTPRVLGLIVQNLLPEIQKLHSDDAARTMLVAVRDGLAAWWRQVPPADLPAAFASDAGALQRHLLSDGVHLLGTHSLRVTT